ncbi:alpha/beta hydrolase [Microbulbifer sp.]|uniref:alpha/beta hydrolase n=1 Tax=Microbulbifer sp. TaxID=1908541 RepID=UPI003F3A1111
MPLHPTARAIIEQLETQPQLHTLTVEAAREHLRQFARSLPQGEAVAAVEDRLVPVNDGEIPIRIYTPYGTGPFPIVVYFHGGGWTIGDLDTDDATCRAITNAAASLVVSVNYRHAPEYKFPTAVEDAYASVCWVADHAAGFNGDPARLAVAGTSAGGNLATVTTLIARDREYPDIAGQVLQVPVTNHAFDTPSYRDCATGYGLERVTGEWFWHNYLRTPEDGAHEYASPLRAASLAGLPAALIITAEFDPLRSEGEAYARHLESAGVPVSYHCKKGMIHLFLGPESMDDIAGFLGSLFY